MNEKMILIFLGFDTVHRQETCRLIEDETGKRYIRFAMTSQAVARSSWSSESHSSCCAWRLNHRRDTSRQNGTHARRCSPPACIAVWITS
jgi:hypothetical protein